VPLDELPGPAPLAERTEQVLPDVALRGLVKAAHAQARRTLEANRALLVEGAGQLLAKETLADDELEALLRRVVMPPSIVPLAAASA
jgi:cell division protease FtsH